MIITLNIQYDEGVTQALMDEVRLGCQAAMAYRFASIVNQNFGFSGEDRPEDWKPLSYQYAKEFHDGNRIPTLQLTGDLQQSIQIEDNNPEAATVWTDCPYAVKHQYGDESTNLPARPFFPIVGDSLTAYAEAECVAAAQNELERILARQ